MPRASSIGQARADKRAGKAPTTQAGHFIHDEIEAVRRGKHGVRSTKQAIAIGLSEARRAGIDVPPKKDITRTGTKSVGIRSTPTKSAAKGDGKVAPRRASSESKDTRARAALEALKREGTAGASRHALSAQSKRAASTRTAADRSASAKKAAVTKGAAGRSEAARKAARTRATRTQAGR